MSPEAPANGDLLFASSSRPKPPKAIPERNTKATRIDPFDNSNGKPKSNCQDMLLIKCVHEL